MSSVSVVIVRAFGPVLVTTTSKVKAPPGAGRLTGVARLSTEMSGVMLMIETVASSLAVTTVPEASVAVTVTTSVCDAPAGPLKTPGNVHGADEAPGARTVPWRAPQVEPGRVNRLP